MLELKNLVVLYSLVGGFAFLTCVTVGTAVFKAIRPESKLAVKIWGILGGWWIINVLLGGACLFGSNGLIALFCVASLLALREFIVVQKLSFIGKPEVTAMLTLVAIHYLFLFLGVKNFFLFVVPVVTYIFLPFLMLSRRKIDGLVHNLWASQSGIMLCLYCLSFAPGLLFLNIHPNVSRSIDPVAAFLFLFITTEMNDVFQFASGKLFGRQKLVVEISPNKTIAGFVGGLLMTSILSLVLAPLMLDLQLWQSLLTGFCIALTGVSGDLMFSSMKRTVGIKDFSQLIPGHGGVLDRLDSMVFTAPTLYCLLYVYLHASAI